MKRCSVSIFLYFICFLQVSIASDTEENEKSPSHPSSDEKRWEALLLVAKKESKALKPKQKSSEHQCVKARQRYQDIKTTGGVKYEKMLEQKRIRGRERRKEFALTHTEEEIKQKKLFESQRNRILYAKTKEKIGYASRRTQKIESIRQLIREGNYTQEHIDKLEEIKRKRKIKYQREKAKRQMKKTASDRN